MAKLNFYDTDAVKAFVLDILIENAELKSDLDYENMKRSVRTTGSTATRKPISK